MVIARAGVAEAKMNTRWQAGLAMDPVELTPLYVRRPEAEELWEKRCGVKP